MFREFSLHHKSIYNAKLVKVAFVATAFALLVVQFALSFHNAAVNHDLNTDTLECVICTHAGVIAPAIKARLQSIWQSNKLLVRDAYQR